MINFYFANIANVILAFFVAISQSAVKPAAPRSAMLSVGDSINGMTLSKGADESHSLWAFCFKSPEGTGSYILDCRVPALASPRIGNSLLYANEAIPNRDWSELVWDLSIDGQAVDLEPFETFNYFAPSMSKLPSSPVLGTFKQGTDWNIVLTDLRPGHHTLWLVAESKIGRYTWFVSLDIEPAEESDYASIPFPLHS